MSELSYQQKYYLANKERLKKYVNEKITCSCGCKVTRINKAKHCRTKKHENRLKELEQEREDKSKSNKLEENKERRQKKVIKYIKKYKLFV